METVEEVGSLDNPPPIERVITEENAKTFQVSTELFILDKIGDYDFTNCKVEFSNPVPVKNSSGTVIGSAVVSVEHSFVHAEVFLDYSTPERLDIQTKATPVYPHLDYNLDGVFKENTVVYEKMYVKAIELRLEPSNDPRIPAL